MVVVRYIDMVIQLSLKLTVSTKLNPLIGIRLAANVETNRCIDCSCYERRYVVEKLGISVNKLLDKNRYKLKREI